MRKLNLNPNSEQKRDAKEMAEYIIKLLRGSSGVFNEELRQFFTWGANKFFYICATDGCVGLQFKVSGLKHRGRVRIWYNYATDYFDVELLKARLEVAVKHYEDIDCFQLHNICHKAIERTDDVEV